MGDTSHKYDFFIAHAGPDREAAEGLFDLLKEHSKPFLDSRMLQLGYEWDRGLTLAQRQSKITVVLVSSQTGDAFYQREEIAAAIALARKDPEGTPTGSGRWHSRRTGCSSRREARTASSSCCALKSQRQGRPYQLIAD